MNKIYFLSNTFGRFHREAGIYANRMSKICSECSYPCESSTEFDFKFFWDSEFGNLERSIAAKHDVFWCETWMLVTLNAATALQELNLPLEFKRAEYCPDELVSTGCPIGAPNPSVKDLLWGIPSWQLEIEPTLNSLDICSSCSKFSQVAWKVAGLKFNAKEVLEAGLFAIRQNRALPMFVTEEIKSKLENAGILGIAFYPAGKIV